MTYMAHLGLALWFVVVLVSIVLTTIYLTNYKIIKYILYVAIAIFAPRIMFMDWWLSIFR